jgi:hypothetical protein
MGVSHAYVSRLMAPALRRASSLAAGLLAAAVTVSGQPAEAPASPPVHEHTEVPHLTLRGFTNVDFVVHEEGQPATFALGQFDLFFSSSISPDISFLAETAVEFEQDETGLDVERVQFKWSPAEAFSLAAGRMHTPLGYWNQTFHHGTWFQTTELRPQMYFFEDDGGVLPVHGVGLAATGAWHGRAAMLKYSVSVLNGRGPDSEHVVHVQDATDNKAVNVWLGLTPTAIEGLEFGASGYFDQVPPNGTERPYSMREQIFTGYVAYRHDGLELLGEATRIAHRRDSDTLETWAGYGQAAVKRGLWTPYYRFDLVDVADQDPYLPPKDLRMHTVGLRVEASDWVALKAEYHFTRDHDQDIHAGRFQLAFAF